MPARRATGAAPWLLTALRTRLPHLRKNRPIVFLVEVLAEFAKNALLYERKAEAAGATQARRCMKELRRCTVWYRWYQRELEEASGMTHD